MKKILQVFPTIIALSLFTIIPTLIPSVALSANNECEELKTQYSNAGGSNVVGDLPAYCSTGEIYSLIINGALYAVGIVGVLVFIYGGYIFMTARGNESQRKKGKTILTWAIVGIAVVILATVLVNVLVKAIVENKFA